MTEGSQHAGLRQRLSHELRQYAVVATYLYIGLGGLLLYKAALLGEHRFGLVPYGTAAVKALVLAKFMMLGHAARLDTPFARHPLAVAVLGNATLFLLLLAVLTVIEEVVVGLLHGQGLGDALRAFAEGRAWEIGASLLLMWLILLPYFAVRQVAGLLGEEGWQRLLATPPGATRSDP